MLMQTPARNHREVAQRYRLEAARCPKTGKVFFPPRVVCNTDEGRCTGFEKVLLTPRGKVLTYTVIHVGPTQFKDETPYVNAIVELEDGARINCMVTDVEPAEVSIGMDVTLEFRKLMSMGTSGILCYGYKAVPAREYKLG